MPPHQHTWKGNSKGGFSHGEVGRCCLWAGLPRLRPALGPRSTATGCDRLRRDSGGRCARSRLSWHRTVAGFGAPAAPPPQGAEVEFIENCKEATVPDVWEPESLWDG